MLQILLSSYSVTHFLSGIISCGNHLNQMSGASEAPFHSFKLTARRTLSYSSNTIFFSSTSTPEQSTSKWILFSKQDSYSIQLCKYHKLVTYCLRSLRLPRWSPHRLARCSQSLTRRDDVYCADLAKPYVLHLEINNRCRPINIRNTKLSFIATDMRQLQC